MLEKVKNGYFLYVIIDGVKINIDGWFKPPSCIKTKYGYYQWIGSFR